MTSAVTRRTGVIVLAAGASSRLGQPKQLLQWQGQNLLRRSATLAVQAAREGNNEPPVVVLGADADRMRGEIDDLSIHITVNAEWEEGMASSLRCGLAALEAVSPNTDAVLVLLCDQPLLTGEVLTALRTVSPDTVAVVSDYESGTGAFGPPCRFDRGLYPELAALRGAQGAKQILARLPVASIARVPFPGGAVDIDTATDWEELRRG